MQHEVLTQRVAEPCRQVMMLPTTMRTGATAPEWIVNDVTKSVFRLGGKRIPRIVRQSCNRVNTGYSIIGSARVDVLVTKVQYPWGATARDDQHCTMWPKVKAQGNGEHIHLEWPVWRALRMSTFTTAKSSSSQCMP